MSNQISNPAGGYNSTVLEFKAVVGQRIVSQGGRESISSLRTHLRDQGFRLSGNQVDFEYLLEQEGFEIEPQYRKDGKVVVSTWVRVRAPEPAFNMLAVRALRKAWHPHSVSHRTGAEADAGFDAGEWSGPAHARMEEDHYDAVLASVAARFDLTPCQLRNMVFESEDVELRALQNARLSPRLRLDWMIWLTKETET
jgi:hypothetical protein